jgi:hypothetical protein
VKTDAVTTLGKHKASRTASAWTKRSSCVHCACTCVTHLPGTAANAVSNMMLSSIPTLFTLYLSEYSLGEQVRTECSIRTDFLRSHCDSGTGTSKSMLYTSAGFSQSTRYGGTIEAGVKLLFFSPLWWFQVILTRSVGWTQGKG